MHRQPQLGGMVGPRCRPRESYPELKEKQSIFKYLLKWHISCLDMCASKALYCHKINCLQPTKLFSNCSMKDGLFTKENFKLGV